MDALPPWPLVKLSLAPRLWPQQLLRPAQRVLSVSLHLVSISTSATPLAGRPSVPLALRPRACSPHTQSPGPLVITQPMPTRATETSAPSRPSIAPARCP
ncbi:hypothetical protein COCVIDRAFT_103107 [Bipolaris victoriae FI3]|uniref:Uncharacterized protein n=2 Tax=Bipolaris TaxID=33194 RepID=W6YIL4_COCC2|nr:uncharacterized protein COCCADRAFT_81041 [Bipolaris zeicola 26-R-13]XP_014555144.1 hypothetical protein COCVIDRAFT_103107 [Bipolaris victoriae FI3]EUC39157.1 hypothetical protein COCCADRAFT_81041 [Bipolaris zeicola 26-R-13]